MDVAGEDGFTVLAVGSTDCVTWRLAGLCVDADSSFLFSY